MPVIKLSHRETVRLTPRAPYNFDANFHKPSHFPSSDECWEEGTHWISMLWQGLELGLKFENAGTIDSPALNLSIYSQKALPKAFMVDLIPEIRGRFNLDSDISEFCEQYIN